jgi:predicted nucleic acid-binding protein
MLVVPDVSASIQILLKAEKELKYKCPLAEADLVVAPDLYVPELTNTLWKYYRAKILTKEQCEQYIQDGIGYIDNFIDSKEIWKEAFTEGINNDHSVYDMLYLITARRNNAVLLTNDSALGKICKKENIEYVF